jgi:hypothetical protein
MAVDHGNAGRGLPLVECSVTFLTPEDGGRAVPWGPGALSGNRYRPHIVIGIPTNGKPSWTNAAGARKNLSGSHSTTALLCLSRAKK